MSNTLYLTYGSFLLYLLLLIIYIREPKVDTLRDRLFKYMFIADLFYLLSDILIIPIYTYVDNSVIRYLIWDFNWIICVISCFILFLYVQLLCIKPDVKSVKDLIKLNFETKLVFTIVVVFCVLFSVTLTRDKFDLSSQNFVGGSSTNIAVVGLVSVFIFALKSLLVGRKNLTDNEKKVMGLFVLVYTVGGISQIFIPNISTIPLAYTLLLFGFYLNSESPTLRIIDSLKEQYNNVVSKEEKTTKLLNEVVGSVNDPLKSINEICFKLNNVSDKEDYKKIFSELEVEGNNFNSIADKTYELSDSNTGEYYLDDVINDSVAIIKDKVKNKDVNLVLDVDESLPSKYRGDFNKLVSLLQKVLLYSVDNTEVGKIVINIKLINNNTLFFKISDSGNGIKKEELSNALEYKGRYDISIYKEYLNSINAKVWVESTLYAGSKFYLQIPQVVVDRTPIKDSIKETVEVNDEGYLDFAGSKILLVCDSKNNSRTTIKILKKYNILIDKLFSKNECIYRIKENKDYDLILLDLKDIKESKEIVKASKLLKDDFKIPPIVLINSYRNREGFDGYIDKPMNVKNINKVLRKFLKENK